MQGHLWIQERILFLRESIINDQAINILPQGGNVINQSRLNNMQLLTSLDMQIFRLQILEVVKKVSIIKVVVVKYEKHSIY
ncbi:hypothetical protein D3C76_1494150 [compost metagenome]